MKIFVTIILSLFLIVIGCTDNSNITAPVNDSSTLGKTQATTITSLTTDDAAGNSVSKVIDGKVGGFLCLGDFTKANSGQSVYAYLYFPAGAFDGTKTITMTLDPKTLSGTFEPSMEFNKPVSFSVLFNNVRVKGTTYSFYYTGTKGEETLIPSAYLYVDQDRGVLGILNAQLPHFSRYAFLR